MGKIVDDCATRVEETSHRSEFDLTLSLRRCKSVDMMGWMWCVVLYTIAHHDDMVTYSFNLRQILLHVEFDAFSNFHAA